MTYRTFDVKRRLIDRMAISIVKGLAFLAVIILVLIIGYILVRGLYSSKHQESVVVPNISSDFIPVQLIANKQNLIQKISFPILRDFFSGKEFSLRRISGVDSDVQLYIENGLEIMVQEYLGLDKEKIARSGVKLADRDAIINMVAKNRGAMALIGIDATLKGTHGVISVPIEDMVLAVHESVTELIANIRLSSIDSDLLDSLLSGSILSWKEVGGQDLPVVVLQDSEIEKLTTIRGAMVLTSYIHAENLGFQTLKFNTIVHSRNLRLDYLIDKPVESGKYGGISTIIGNTLFMVIITILIAGPLGIGAAAFLVEYPHNKRLLSIIRSGIDVLAGIPSIIFGLFGLLVFVQLLNWKFSLISGSMTIAIMILPTIIRTSEEAIRSVPRSLVEASIALGATKVETIWKVIIPTASPGITTGIILAIGRAVGETAALIYTIGSSPEFATGLLDSARVLSMHIFLTITEGQSLDRAFASALVLVVLVLIINTVARFSARRLVRNGR
jgi:phosphate transport system permease protein